MRQCPRSAVAGTKLGRSMEITFVGCLQSFHLGRGYFILPILQTLVYCFSWYTPKPLASVKTAAHDRSCTSKQACEFSASLRN